MVRNYFNYFTEVEEYFVQRRGKNLLVSPLDWCLIELWKENGIPLHVVLRGIDRSLESAARLAKSGPRNLYYCHPAVMEAFQEFQQGTLGSHLDPEEPAREGGEVVPEQIAEFLGRLEQAMRKRPEEPCRRTAERLESLGEEVRRLESASPELLDRELAGLSAVLVGKLVQGLSAEVVRQIEEESDEELAPYRKRLSKKMFARLRERHLEMRFREHLGLPDFSLLNL